MAIVKNGWLHCRINTYCKSLKETAGVETSEWRPFSMRLEGIISFRPFSEDDYEQDKTNGGDVKDACVVWSKHESVSFSIDISANKLREYLDC